MRIVNRLVPRIVKDKLKDSPLGLVRSLYEEIKFFRGHRFYGQTAEDAVLQLLLKHDKGFYLDIGAGKPKRGSNTQVFYRRAGWSGILVDPISRNVRILKLLRPKDRIIEALIGVEKGPIPFWEFDPYEYSTAVKAVADGVLLIDGVRLKECSNRTVLSLEDISSGYDFSLPTLLSIDCEGFDLQVLKSNNWENFRPTVICIEEWDFNFSAIDSEIGVYLLNLGYSRFAYTGLSCIYVDNTNSHGIGKGSTAPSNR